MVSKKEESSGANQRQARARPLHNEEVCSARASPSCSCVGGGFRTHPHIHIFTHTYDLLGPPGTYRDQQGPIGTNGDQPGPVGTTKQRVTNNRMDSKEDCVLRSRCQTIPKMPFLSDGNHSIDDDEPPTEHLQNGETYIKTNGKIEVEHVISKKIELKRKAEFLKNDLMRQFDSHVNDFMDSLIDESTSLEPAPVSAVFSPPLSDKERNKLGHFRPPHGQGKQFVSRRSLLDELFEVNHIRTIYHMFIALLILFILSTLVVDFLDEGRLVLDFDLLVYAFGQFPLVVSTWICMFLSVLVVPYSLFYFWSQSRAASRFIIILEQIRLIMKVHSFVRENVPKVLAWTKDKGRPNNQVPQVSHYLYFLFAPTLIYRDKYPRNPVTRWGYVATKFLQVLGSLFYAYYVFVRLCIPQFRSISLQFFDLRAMVLCVFNSILPGVLVLFLGFFAFLHCWLNAFAEMLCFADRMFYKDWWNSTSFANYYRTWNVVVHDWLYYYIYRDLLWMSRKRFRAGAMLFVFTVSAVVHEYILAVCFGFFYPVLFCLFMCFGMMFNFILNDQRKGPIWNIIMWTSLFLGQGVIICLYSQEWYAQSYCPLKEPSFFELLKPRSWSCVRDRSMCLGAGGAVEPTLLCSAVKMAAAEGARSGRTTPKPH
uniref:Sterol O-acyltransferase 1 n=1 Tax=Knipowitschia caucasica TaxID=637954 RepID=A0AAV2KZL7_KNICA